MALYVRMTDTFLSGWGDAAGKTNVLVVECDTKEQHDQIFGAAEFRSEMKRIQTCLYPPKERAGVQHTRRHYDDLSGDWKRS